MANPTLAEAARLRLPRRRRAPRMPRIEYPRAIENAYAAALRKDVRILRRLTDELVLPELLALPGVRADSPFDVNMMIDRARLEARRETNAYSLAELFALRTIDGNTQTWRKVAKAVMGIDVFDTPRKQDMLLTFATNNTQLIRTVHERYFDDVAALAADAVRGGVHARKLADVLQERLAVSEWNAERIARDQIGKLNGATTKANHEALGVRRYRWQTSGDGRVREAHASVNGEVFSYDDPPAVGVNGEKVNPGEDILCRCVAIPLFEGFDDAIA